MGRRLVIAIDGPSGAGKSTVARLLSGRLGYTYIDTGALYRALGWKARKTGIDATDEQALERLLATTVLQISPNREGQRVYVDSIDVTGEIRTSEMGMLASLVSRSPAVRACLLTLQRELGARGGVVMDGRDIGTIVFPRADVKFYLDATPEERGRRRFRELKEKGLDVDLAVITDEIRRRDEQDRNRVHAPLRRAEDAVVIDSSSMTVDQVVDAMLAQVNDRDP